MVCGNHGRFTGYTIMSQLRMTSVQIEYGLCQYKKRLLIVRCMIPMRNRRERQMIKAVYICRSVRPVARATYEPSASCDSNFSWDEERVPPPTRNYPLARGTVFETQHRKASLALALAFDLALRKSNSLTIRFVSIISTQGRLREAGVVIKLLPATLNDNHPAGV
jgi:hypothetical protein